MGALPNGLPDSSDVITQGINAGTGWLLKGLGLPDDVTNAVALIVDVPAAAFEGLAGGAAVASGANIVAGGALSVLSSVAPEVASALAEVVGTALNVVPVLGVTLEAMSALADVIAALEKPPTLTTEGPNGPFTMDVSFYAAKAVPVAVNDAPKFLTMPPAAFAVQETISVDDCVIMPAPGGALFIPWDNPFTEWTRLPGANSILHSVQLSAGAAAAAAAANVLDLFVGFTGPSMLPLIAPAEWTEIRAAAQPIHDAIVQSAQAWADSQNPKPTDLELNKRYGLLPHDRDAILAAWHSDNPIPPPPPPPPKAIVMGSPGPAAAIAAYWSAFQAAKVAATPAAKAAAAKSAAAAAAKASQIAAVALAAAKSRTAAAAVAAANRSASGGGSVFAIAAALGLVSLSP